MIFQHLVQFFAHVGLLPRFTSFYLVLLRSEVFRRLRDGPVVLRTAALGVAGQWTGRLELPGRGGSWIQKKDTF